MRKLVVLLLTIASAASAATVGSPDHAAAAGTAFVRVHELVYDQLYTGLTPTVATTTELTLVPFDFSGPLGTITIRPPAGQTFGVGTFLLHDGPPDATFGQIGINGRSCPVTVVSGAMVVDHLVVVGTDLTEFAIRVHVDCAEDTSARFVLGSDPTVVAKDHHVTVQGDISLGSLTTGVQSGPVTLEIQNTGTDDLELLEVGDPGDEFAATDTCPTPLPSGDTCTVSIRMHPTKLSHSARTWMVPIRTSTFAEFPTDLELQLFTDSITWPAWHSDVGRTVVGARTTSYTPIVADFDGDRRDHDIIWWGPRSGPDDLLWTFTKGVPSASPLSLPAGAGYWAIDGNFDADDKEEILFYGEGARADMIWTHNGTTTGNRRTVSIGHTRFPLAGDFDGDGVTDILWYGPGRSTHPLWFWNANGTITKRSVAMAGNLDNIIIGDLDGDGRDDLLLWRSTASSTPVWLMRSRTRHSTRSLSTPPGRQPVLVELDENTPGRDIMWFQRGRDQQRIALGADGWTLTGPLIRSHQSAVPRIANFDGDDQGYSDILWWNLAGGYNSLARGRLRDIADPATDTSTRRFSWSIIGHFREVSTTDSSDHLWFVSGTNAGSLHFRFADRDFPTNTPLARTRAGTSGSGLGGTPGSTRSGAGPAESPLGWRW